MGEDHRQGIAGSAPPRRPKLDPFTGIIDRILEDDRTSHHKQRHTAKRIFDRLRDEYGFTGGYTIVKDYVRERRLRSREVFVPLAHSPGHDQADFGEAMAVIGGVARKVHFLAFDLPHSDGCFVKTYPAETTEAFCDGHNVARPQSLSTLMSDVDRTGQENLSSALRAFLFREMGG